MKILFTTFVLLFLSFGSAFASDQYVKTGYFTSFFAREHDSDMPREFYLLIEEDGTIVPISFHEHKSSGQYSIWNFDPRPFLGKTVTVDVKAKLNYNNNEYNYYEGNDLKVVPRLWVETINSFKEASTSIPAPAEYKYPQADTLLMPHDVLVKEEVYADQNPTKVIQLTDYVTGDGTDDLPYISADGYAGLKAAIADLPQGGTIEVPYGIYKATSNRLYIPRFVSIKGVGAKKPYFILTTDRMWYLKGSNTIDFIDVDVTQNTRSYTHEVIAIHNNARDVMIKNSKFICNYQVDPNNNYKESGNVVMFRLYSHLNNITFQGDTIVNPLRSISTKGQKNQHNLVFRECVFQGQGQMCITLDQSSDISDVVIEDNKFIEFTHFGIALARINGVVIRNNTFYSRNLESFNTYNQAIHIEEHTQNILIEDNLIDVTLRNAGSGDPNSTVRSYGIIAMDARHLTIRNNDIRHSSVLFGSGSATHVGQSVFLNNRLENGALQIKDACKHIVVKDNEFVNPPAYAVDFYSTKPMLRPFGWHTIESNRFTDMGGKQPITVKALLNDISITNNTFEGCGLKASKLEVYPGSTAFTLTNNTFYGTAKENAFEVIGSLLAPNSLNTYLETNTFTTECGVTGIGDKKETEAAYIYPNPVRSGAPVTIANNAATGYIVYNNKGGMIDEGKGQVIPTVGYAPGIYLVHIQAGGKRSVAKLVVTQ